MMITFPETTLCEVEASHELDSLIKPLVANGWDINDFKRFLGSSKLRAIKDEEFLGFFLYEPVSDSVEVHAFVLPQYRNRSMSILRAFRTYLTDNLGFTRIVTTVTGDYGYIVRLLKMIGFQITNVEDGAVVKDSGTFNVTYLEYVKE